MEPTEEQKKLLLHMKENNENIVYDSSLKTHSICGKSGAMEKVKESDFHALKENNWITRAEANENEWGITSDGRNVISHETK